ncbi:MAG: Flp pilus assembly protein CpaB [Candidatus Firestonebacteria bacterium]|nr:Flp pilus assembly protein CpaB [Candidatus Firestonebacteria bacterium]
MNKQTLIALVLAAAAALMSYYYLSEKEDAVRADVSPVKVLIAKKPIPRGGRLTLDKLTIQEIPGAYVMPGAVSASNQENLLKQWNDFSGQFAVVPIAKGEQILPNKLSKLLPGFAGVVPEGMRIMTFALEAAAAVGGHLKPGNHVDVLGTFDFQFKGVKRLTTVVLSQDLLITGVGDETTADRGKDKPASYSASQGGTMISLALTPEDAVRLSLAEKEGSLKLALRSLGDEDKLSLPDQSLGTVLGPLMRTQADDIKSAPRRLEIIKGLQ